MLRPTAIVEYYTPEGGVTGSYPVYIYTFGPLSIFIRDFDKAKHPTYVYEIGYLWGDWKRYKPERIWRKLAYSVTHISIKKPRLEIERWLQTCLLQAVEESTKLSREARDLCGRHDSRVLSSVLDWRRFGSVCFATDNAGSEAAVYLLLTEGAKVQTYLRKIVNCTPTLLCDRYNCKGDFDAACVGLLAEIGDALEACTED